MWILLGLLLPSVVLIVFSCSDGKRSKEPVNKKKDTSSKSLSSTQSTKSQGGELKSLTSSKSKKNKLKVSSQRSQRSSKSVKNGKKTKSEKSVMAEKKTGVVDSSKKNVSIKSNKKSCLPSPTDATVFAEPPALYFTKLGGIDKFQVVNRTNERRAFKLKCSDNQMYRFMPIAGFIPPNGTAVVEVMRQNGTGKADKAILVSTLASDGGDAKAAVEKAQTTDCQMTIVPLLANA